MKNLSIDMYKSTQKNMNRKAKNKKYIQAVGKI